MSILRTAQAGTLESSDIMITVSYGPPSNGIKIELESIVMAQYGEDIRRVITETVHERGLADLYVKAVDRGALDCTIRARMLTVLARAVAKPQEAGS